MGGLGLLGITGCGDAGALVGPSVTAADVHPPSIRRLGPEAVAVQATALRNTPGGCEIDITFKNVSRDAVLVGFSYLAFDVSGREVKKFETGVMQTDRGETKTISTGDTTAGPSGIPCSRIASIRLDDVSVWATPGG